MYSAASMAAPVYIMMDSSTLVFAYSVVTRNYVDSAAFCKSLWMGVASIHCKAEDEAIVQLLGVTGVFSAANKLSDLKTAVPLIQRLGGPKNSAIVNGITLPPICKAK